MKKSIRIFSLAMLLSGTMYAGTGKDLESEKTKTYSKSYAVGSGDKITLDNKFGDMKISTWNKNEVKVDINISVKANTDDQAAKLLDIILIEDGKSGSDIHFKTRLRDKDNDDNGDRKGDNINNNNSTNFKIDYTVYLPANATLEATNQFGDMNIGDYDGLVSLISKFGSLTAGRLSEAKKVTIQFGKSLSTIESMNGGKLSVQFSRALVNKLSGEVMADFTQSRSIKLKLDNSLKKLTVNNSFSEILLDADKNLSASFNIKASFGIFTNESSFAVTKSGDDDNRYNHNYTYTGKAGSGAAPVTINSSFGSVLLGHNLPMDASNKIKNADRRDKIKL